ncbi:MAG: twitch domain-containing radical SAM protein [Chitinophagales bacterium]|nr:twitch domain-containing radical SAM protein [Chitinophagales bacterium]
MSWLEGLKKMVGKGEIPKRDPDKTDFCYYPFFQVLMTAGGKYMPCSKHEAFITHQGRVLTSDKDSIEDAWNSDYMRDLRDSFLNNGKHFAGCNECWREQAMGLRPMRYDSYGYNVSEKQVQKPLMPMRVEINASNICNLRCRICMPTASHRWIPEAKKLYNWNEETHFNMTPQNIEAIKSWVPNFTQIGFFGGEPLMSHENIDLMRHCVETGHSKHISILLNTNGTVYSDEIVQLFLQFQKVFINFSIDDIGERFEYQRSGAKWDEVVQNMKSYLKHGGHTDADVIEAKICCSVTNMNIWYFPEYFQFMNEHFPGMPVYWNLVYAPHEFSLEILPDQVKEKIRERLRNYVKTSYQPTREKTKTVEDLIIFLENKIDKDFGSFFKKIKQHDEYRQEDFAKVFPEWWEVIKEYEMVVEA